MGVTSEFGPAPADLEPPRGKTSVGRRHAIQYREQIQEKLRASRRCSDCVHFGFGTVDVGSNWQPHDVPEVSCERGRFTPDGRGGNDYAALVRHEDYLREALRTAASCDDYEEVDDSEEGVG